MVSGLAFSDPACNFLRCDVDDKSGHLRTGYIVMIRVARDSYSQTNLNQHKIFADQRHFFIGFTVKKNLYNNGTIFFRTAGDGAAPTVDVLGTHETSRPYKWVDL